MSISLFDIAGPIMVGPSSSHTAGANQIGKEAFAKLKNRPEIIEITLFNSFADTGEGHSTDKAILAGCLGISCYEEKLKESFSIADSLGVKYKISKRHSKKYHPNTAEIKMHYKDNFVHILGISLGGGRAITKDFVNAQTTDYSKERTSIKSLSQKDPFYSFTGFIKDYDKTPDKIIDILIAREKDLSGKNEIEIRQSMIEIWHIMKRGITENVKLKDKMLQGLCGGDANLMKKADNLFLLNDLTKNAMAYAMAIGERNVSMGQIVAIPTAGSAGILAGCLYSLWENRQISEEHIINALLIASAIGLTAAIRATLAGAEAGCQAECGVASAMAAGAITYIQGGSVDKIDNAAGLALGNALGLVCDPVGGIVAVPCIQRNGLYANMAIASAAMTLAGINFVIYLDEVLDAMMGVGREMSIAFRETSRGGLARTKTGVEYTKKILSHRPTKS